MGSLPGTHRLHLNCTLLGIISLSPVLIFCLFLAQTSIWLFTGSRQVAVIGGIYNSNSLQLHSIFGGKYRAEILDLIEKISTQFSHFFIVSTERVCTGCQSITEHPQLLNDFSSLRNPVQLPATVILMPWDIQSHQCVP